MKNHKHYFLVALLGIVATFALPPFKLFPLLILVLPLLLVMVDRAKTSKQAFWTGWWFGFGHFVTGLYWIANSLLVDAVRFAWLIPFAISLIPAALAVYTGLVTLSIHYLKPKTWRKPVLFACLWVMAEILRGYLFTGFPWNLIGYSLNFSDYFIQFASIGGIYGQSFLTVLFASMFYLLLKVKKDKVAVVWSRNAVIPVAVVSAMLIASGMFGYIRLHNPQPATKTLTVHMIQANIKQEMKWEPDKMLRHVLEHVVLTRTALEKQDSAKPSLIVWSETSVPYFIEMEPDIMKMISTAIPPNSVLATGALRGEKYDKGYKVWNSMFFLGNGEKILAYYDKFHLVPFGEYVPFRKLLPFINKITPGMEDFSEGKGNVTLDLGDFLASPLICYEVIFPGRVVDKKNTPDIMVNATNDAWFGTSTGPYQHLEMARVRAVEEGVSLVRVANTGVSAVFDGYGRQLAAIPLNKSGHNTVEVSIAPIKTIFGRYGNLIILLVVVVFSGFLGFLQKK